MGVEGYWARVSDGVEAFTADIEEWEGNVDHMYLATRGFVTVGKGKMLPAALVRWPSLAPRSAFLVLA